ncbi:MAG: Ig-like domain-containing protein [Patescibacteria group bacterium]
MKKIAAVFLLLFSLLMSSISVLANDWPVEQSNTTRNAYLGDFPVSSDLSVQWTKNAELNNFQLPVYSNGIIYFSEEGHYISGPKLSYVYAVEKSSGREIWRKTFPEYLKSDIYAGDGKVIVPGETLKCLDGATGTTIWEKSASTAGYYFVEPMIVGDKLIAIYRGKYGGGSIIGYNLSNGVELWRTVPLIFSNGRILSVYNGNILATVSTSYNETEVSSFSSETGAKNWTYVRGFNPNGPVIVDEVNGIGFLSSIVNITTAIDLNTGLKRYEYPAMGTYNTTSVIKNRTAHWLSIISSQTYFNSCGLIDKVCSQKQIDTRQNYLTGIEPLMIGNDYYYLTNTGKLKRYNVAGGMGDSYSVDPTRTNLQYLLYFEGMFVAMDYYKTKMYVLGSGAEPIDASSVVELDSPYKTDGVYGSYLGQLHSHYIPDVALWSKIFNGDPTPAFTEQKYKDAGYDFVALTEHNMIIPDPGVGGILHIVNSEEDTQDPGGNHILAIGVNSPIDEAMSEQDRINAVANQGGVPILAHPNSAIYPWSQKTLFSLNNYNILEIKNGVTQRLDYLHYLGSSLSTDKWDNLLGSSRKILGTAGDDYTPGDAGFDNASVVVFSKTNSQSDILQNLKDGNFYALQGSSAPKINIQTSGNKITISSDRQSNIRFISRGKTIQENRNTASATYTANGSEIYIRAEVESGGKRSWSQPIFVNLKQVAKTPFPGGYKISFAGGTLTSKNTSPVEISTLSQNQYPSNSPQLGYLSQIYSLLSQSQPSDGTKLTLSYDGRTILTNENNLSIYNYNSGNSAWEKVPSIIDKTKKTVSAFLSHFSLYTLSAEEPEDLEKPTINLTSPIDMNDLSGSITLEASAADNNAVIKTGFYADDRLIGEDTDPTDGWSGALDVNSLKNGEHKIIVTAEDLSGNVGEAEYLFTVTSSTFLQPTILLFEPLENSELWELSDVSGGFNSNLPVSDISILLDGYVVAEAEISGGNFSKEINWQDYREGEHELKVVLVDEEGNIAETARTVNISDVPRVEIISPDKEQYLESDQIEFSYNSNNENVVAELDGNIIENGIHKFGYEIGLGKHTYILEYKARILAQKEFEVYTNFFDVRNLITMFYQEGDFSNNGIYIATLSQLKTAESADASGKESLSDSLLQLLIKFIAIQNSVGHLSDFAEEILINSLNYLTNI